MKIKLRHCRAMGSRAAVLSPDYLNSTSALILALLGFVCADAAIQRYDSMLSQAIYRIMPVRVERITFTLKILSPSTRPINREILGGDKYFAVFCYPYRLLKGS